MGIIVMIAGILISAESVLFVVRKIKKKHAVTFSKYRLLLFALAGVALYAGWTLSYVAGCMIEGAELTSGMMMSACKVGTMMVVASAVGAAAERGLRWVLEWDGKGGRRK